jgi:Flp pilus assembly protein TadB
MQFEGDAEGYNDHLPMMTHRQIFRRGARASLIVVVLLLAGAAWGGVYAAPLDQPEEQQLQVARLLNMLANAAEDSSPIAAKLLSLLAAIVTLVFSQRFWLGLLLVVAGLMTAALAAALYSRIRHQRRLSRPAHTLIRAVRT